MQLLPTPRFHLQHGRMVVLPTHRTMPNTAAPFLGHCSSVIAWHRYTLGPNWSLRIGGATSQGWHREDNSCCAMRKSPAQRKRSVSAAAAAGADGSTPRQGSTGRDVWQRGGGANPNGGGSNAREVSSGGPSSSRRRPSRDRGTERRSPNRGRSSEAGEPVVFRGSFPRDPEVAILGGGLSGLMCALALAEEGIRSTVFDTGRHGWGGRLGTRHLDVPRLSTRAPAANGSHSAGGAADDTARESGSSKHPGEAVTPGPARGVFDHAAQFFTVSDPRFESQVAKWLKKGWVREWEGCVGTLSPGGAFTLLPVNNATTSAKGSGIDVSSPIHRPSPQGASTVPQDVPIGLQHAAAPTASAAPAAASLALACEPAALGLAPSIGFPAVAARGSSPQGGVLDRGEVWGSGLKGRGWGQLERMAGGTARANGAAATSWEADGLAPNSEVRRGSRYVATGGMRQLADRLAEECKETGLVSLERPIWITRMHFSGAGREGGAECGPEKWRLVDEYGKERSEYDFVVIAHNGKCANRLLAPAGVRLVAGQMKRLQLSSIWCSMVAFGSPLPVPTAADRPRGMHPHEEEGVSRSAEKADAVRGMRMEGAFVEGVPSVAWMCNNSAKLGREGERGGGAGGLECWTVFSSAEYGRQNKVPQERIPPHVAERVKEEMLEGVRAALGVPPDQMPPVAHHRVQLWGAALPLNSPGVEFIFDPQSRTAICGDWLMAPSMEAAAVSGMGLAAQISAFAAKGTAEGVGLRDPLIPISDAHDIGAFP